MNSIIVSIPHTGTRFLSQRLGVEECIHSHAAWDRLIKDIEGKKIYSPLRNPINVWRSWSRRTNPERGFPYITFSFAWYTMNILDQLYDVEFINLEAQDDSRITNWSPVGDDEKGTSYEAPMIDDFRKVFQLPFVKRHYPHLTQKRHAPNYFREERVGEINANTLYKLAG